MIKKNGTTRRRQPRTREKSKFLELAIVALFALVLIYGASFAIRVTHGFSKTIDMPEYSVRLQILNGCGVTGAAAKVAKALPTKISLPLEVAVLDTDDFNSYDVKETFIISRDNDMKAAKIFAEQLGLKIDNIVYKPVENNYRSISLTLVLGDDFETIIKP